VPDVEAFISRWQASGGAERANYTLFLTEFCDLIGVARPAPATGGLGDYRFERAVTRQENDGTTSTRRIDLYKRDCFVLEAKQALEVPLQESLFGDSTESQRRTNRRHTKGWAQALEKAKGQAADYARDLPLEEGWPPFLIITDVGFCFDLYADFSRTGKHYAQFSDGHSFRIFLTDFRKPEVRELFRRIWTEPMMLDPAQRRLEVTRDVAALLAKLSRALEARKHTPEAVASFLMRSVFSMFAQSVGLLPSPTAFTDLLAECRANPASFVGLVGEMWRTMNTGGFSAGLRTDLKRFNGGLFAPGPHGPVEPLKLEADMIELLLIASRRDWAEVEPAIFGTLLENALTEPERNQLGAHFTPRAFVEHLVQHAVMDPLLEDWAGEKAAAVARAEAGDRPGAAAILRQFHARLCNVKVLDPACGTANFLYVALDLMKRLEAEVLDFLANLAPGEGERLDLAQSSVDPHQFLGIELNPRAVPVAELVLWIGWLQWQFRTRGAREIAEPILRDFHNIQRSDALLDYRSTQPVKDAQGRMVTRWGGRTKPHPITGEDVPDETDRVLVQKPVKPKPTAWPEADFIIGNPPFIAGKDLRADLGDGYAEALWETYPKVNKSADLALHFWWKSAQLLAAGNIRRFGLITSNSLRQVFCRRVVAEALAAKQPIHLTFAVPDHPWTAGPNTAAVRIAMTAAARGSGIGELARVVAEEAGEGGVPRVRLETMQGLINADLTIGTDVKSARPLRANNAICSDGVKLHGKGFRISPVVAMGLGLGKLPGLERHIRPYLNGRDLTQQSRGLMVIDLFGLSEPEVRTRYGAVWQYLAETVKPQRDAAATRSADSAQYAREWWLFGKVRPELRAAIKGLPRYIGTVDTARHRVFSFIDSSVVVDDKVVVIASESGFHLGVLQSCFHVAWVLAQGNWLGAGNDAVYAKTQCFDPFPFPAATPAQQALIGAIAEELDAFRKARLAAHDHLTLTGLYNALALLRSGRPLTEAERDVHAAGQISILAELHNRLDAAVAAAYGWPADLTDAEIVARVVALNAERVREEAEGLIRWLRPEYQAPQAKLPVATQRDLDIGADQAVAVVAWPREEGAQYKALRAVLRHGPAHPRDIARRLRGAPRGDKLPRMLANLEALGLARSLEGGRFTA
jgi:hypothetical protein